MPIKFEITDSDGLGAYARTTLPVVVAVTLSALRWADHPLVRSVSSCPQPSALVIIASSAAPDLPTTFESDRRSLDRNGIDALAREIT